MTSKEKREVNRLRNENEELQARRQKDAEIYRRNIDEITGLRIALRNAHDALIDAVTAVNMALHDTDRRDLTAKIWVEPNF